MKDFLSNWGQMLLFVIIVIGIKFVFPLAFVMEVMIFTIYVLGCNMLMGYLGKVSFGQPAYMAFGAYGTAIYLFYLGDNPLIGVLAGVLTGLVLASLLGLFFIRLESAYFTLSNLALLVIAYFTFQKALSPITHGDEGLWFLSSMSKTPIINLTTLDGIYLFILIVTILVFLFAKYLLQDSVLGSSFLAVKTNEKKLSFLGYNTFRVKWSGFVIAQTITALAGALYSLYFGFVSAGVTATNLAIEPIVVSLLGGVGTLLGPIVGSIVFIGLKDMVGDIVQYWELVVGLLLVFIMLQGEAGIVGGIINLIDKFSERRLQEKSAAGKTL